MYVCPVVCINIYFAPNVPKVWGLQSQPLGLLSISVSHTHPAPGSCQILTERHHMFASEADLWHGQPRFTLGYTSLGQFGIFYNDAFSAAEH